MPKKISRKTGEVGLQILLSVAKTLWMFRPCKTQHPRLQPSDLSIYRETNCSSSFPRLHDRPKGESQQISAASSDRPTAHLHLSKARQLPPPLATKVGQRMPIDAMTPPQTTSTKAPAGTQPKHDKTPKPRLQLSTEDRPPSPIPSGRKSRQRRGRRSQRGMGDSQGAVRTRAVEGRRK
jgi:hypothetical protein